MLLILWVYKYLQLCFTFQLFGSLDTLLSLLVYPDTFTNECARNQQKPQYKGIESSAQCPPRGLAKKVYVRAHITINAQHSTGFSSNMQMSINSYSLKSKLQIISYIQINIKCFSVAVPILRKYVFVEWTINTHSCKKKKQKKHDLLNVNKALSIAFSGYI